MKKWMSIVALVAAVASLTTGCSEKKKSDGGSVSAPAITLEGGDISRPQEIVQGMSARILISAPGRIKDFTVKIDSPALTDELLGTLHLSTTLDMVNPSEEAAAAFASLGLKYGQDVKGQTSVPFDVSALVPMIAMICKEASDHKFVLSVTDELGRNTVQTVTFHLSASDSASGSDSASDSATE